MPELNWIGKEDVLSHHNEIPYRLLKAEPSLSFGEHSENLIIQGDNLIALKALLPYYEGRIKCIYIDPPYNTGNEKWAYNDNVNSPTIQKWLREIVKKDTLDRHSRWLCMMYPRLKLLHQLLANDGAIFISIDNNEIHRLRNITDEIFRENNFVTLIANINNPKGRSDDKYVPTAHEYLLVYKNDDEPNLLGWKPEDRVIKRYRKIDTNGKRWREIDLRKTGDNDLRQDRENLFYYFLYNRNTKEFYPIRENIIPSGFIQIKPMREDGREGNWRWELNTSLEKIKLLYPKLMPKRKVWTVFEMDYLDDNELIKPTTAWTKKEFNSERGTEQLLDLGFTKQDFPKPKPVGLLKHILEFSTDKDDIILDSFAGSGTTAHAVMQLNIEDGGNRKYILVEMEENICKEITAERVKRVARGYTNSKRERVKGLGGDFQYCTLGEELKNSLGEISDTVIAFPDLAHLVWYQETKTSWKQPTQNGELQSFLGKHNGTSYYLFFNGIMGDTERNKANVLTPELFKKLTRTKNPKVVYAEQTLINKTKLKKHNIQFRQVPQDIRTK
jgi:adenine-specific DNA-methyltransferase